MKKGTSSCRALLITFLFSIAALEGAAPGFAGELTLFGPKRCTRTERKPPLFHYHFSSLAEQEGYIPGTLLIWNGTPERTHQVGGAWVWVNGKMVVTPQCFDPEPGVLHVPLQNLGSSNRITVKLDGKPGSYLTLQVAELGPRGPLFSGPRQYPFVCRVEQSGLGQPLVDNFKGDGIPIFAEEGGRRNDSSAGYCKDCSTVTRVDYFYRTTGGDFQPLERFSVYPADLAYTTTNAGKRVPYIVRLERGSINRFLYSIAMLQPWDSRRRPIRAWNRKLFFRFDGGVAIGHDQGVLSMHNCLEDQVLRRGYAMAYSTANRTAVHFNLQVAGETALMMKKHFKKRFGNPEFTMSTGISGASIQQYAFAWNLPGLLDGIIPQRSYSDMVTQSIYVGDCMLLEYYFDVIAPLQGDDTFGGFAFDPATGAITHLGSPANRTWLEGMSASDSQPHPIYTPLTGGQTGSTECVNGWLGLTPLGMNPLYTDVDGINQFPDDVVLDVKWTHWDDLRNIYGVDADGYAPCTWDNVGVQYGLQALVAGNITLDQFLDINARIGGWKKPIDMVPEGFPFSAINTIQYLVGPEPDPRDFDLWSIRNSTFALSGIAPRTQGDIEAMHAAYRSGHVFLGRLDIPALDIREYLDPVLDMHHAQQSFATRKRILDGEGDVENQVIWMKDRFSDYDIEGAAIDLMDHWLTNIKKHPQKGVAGNKPSGAVDKCVGADNTAYEGPDVWDGIIDDRPEGPCTQRFKMYSTSRILAGGDIKGDIFKCHLIPVEEAIERGFYAHILIDDETRARLEAIFPDGVCDYAQGDAGRPEEV